jgi:hypothetical protein
MFIGLVIIAMYGAFTSALSTMKQREQRPRRTKGVKTMKDEKSSLIKAQMKDERNNDQL